MGIIILFRTGLGRTGYQNKAQCQLAQCLEASLEDVKWRELPPLLPSSPPSLLLCCLRGAEDLDIPGSWLTLVCWPAERKISALSSSSTATREMSLLQVETLSPPEHSLIDSLEASSLTFLKIFQLRTIIALRTLGAKVSRLVGSGESEF